MTSETTGQVGVQGTSVPVWPLLPLLGFIPDAGVVTDGPIGLSLRCPGLDLHAARSLSQYMQPVVLVLGHWRSERTLAEVHVELLPTVTSLDQLKALLAYGIGRDCPASPQLPWLAEGHELRSLLPWEQERAAHAQRRAARPHCVVGRPWMRLFLREVRNSLESAVPDSPCSVWFDGVVLICEGASFRVATPAVGPAPWPTRHRISARALGGLPRRLAHDPVEVGVWEGALEVGRLRLLDRATVTPMED